jgi:hypothetical protein
VLAQAQRCVAQALDLGAVDEAGHIPADRVGPLRPPEARASTERARVRDLGDNPASSSRTSIACTWVGVSLLSRTLPTWGVIQWLVIHR